MKRLTLLLVSVIGVTLSLTVASSASAKTATVARPPLVRITGSSLAQLLDKHEAPLPNTMVAAEQSFKALLKTTHASAQSVTCYANVSIQSDANALFVSTEVGYGGSYYAMLRARASQVGAWEMYTECRYGSTGLTYIVSQANNLAVSAELGYGGANYAMLRARASKIGPWENWYTSQDPCNGCTTVFFDGGNGLYASAELGYGGATYAMLRARASQIGPWETFNW